MEKHKPIVIAAFYKFVPLPDFEEMRYPLLAFCKKHALKGTILLAHEGINSTISGSRENMDIFFEVILCSKIFIIIWDCKF